MLAFVFKDWIKDQLNLFINNNIRAYRDDIDLQNLIDFTQEYVSGGRGPPGEGGDVSMRTNFDPVQPPLPSGNAAAPSEPTTGTSTSTSTAPTPTPAGRNAACPSPAAPRTRRYERH